MQNANRDVFCSLLPSLVSLKFTFEPTTLFVNEFSEANLGFECSDTPCHRIVDAFQLNKNQFSVHGLEKLMVRSLI